MWKYRGAALGSGKAEGLEYGLVFVKDVVIIGI